MPPEIVVEPELALSVPLPVIAAKLSVALPPDRLPLIVLVPTTVMPRLFVASLRMPPEATVKVPPRFKAFDETTIPVVAVDAIWRLLIGTAVVTVADVPVIENVE
jgi:hypothetical protein